jgi:Recombination endonuclease VII
VNKICKTDGCGKKVRARGFCVACYYRNLRHGEVKSGTQTDRWKHRLINTDEENRMADCSACGRVKVTSGKQKNGKIRWRCSIDTNSRSRDYKRAYRQSKKIQLKDHCEICHSTDNLCWDHDHVTGIFRGTLCKSCNVAIGHLKDNVEKCKNAAKYLCRHRMAFCFDELQDLLNVHYLTNFRCLGGSISTPSTHQCLEPFAPSIAGPSVLCNLP